MPVDAETWLAERGIRREPIRVAPAPAPERISEPSHGSVAGSEGGAGASGQHDTGPALSARDAARLAVQSAADAELREADAAATPDPSANHLEDDVAAAVAFIRRSTSVAPQAEGRVRDKLAERGWGSAVIDQALLRARRERLVDDAAMAGAIVEERQRKGHAPSKIRQDLRTRGFDDRILDEVLARAEQQDLEAAAFAVAKEKADRSGSLEAEAAYRRVVGHVVRRGYPEGLARKVAREAVFTAREREQAAGH